MGKNLVLEVRDLRIIPEVMDLIRRSKIKEVSIDDMEGFLQENLGKEDTRLVVSFDGDKVTGFVLAYVVYSYRTPEVFIAWAYVDPHDSMSGKYLMFSIDEWARKLGIKKISAMVRTNLKGFEKKYGFKLDHYNVSKEVS